MKIQFLSTADRTEMQGGSDAEQMLAGPLSTSKLAASRQMKQMSAAREVVNYLISNDGRAHNGPAARILAAASSWAYSDLNTFATVLGAFGLSGEFVGINVDNEPNLIDTTAYLFVSAAEDDRPGRLAILAFRGTTPSNTITWLTDANTLMEPLGEGGRAHGGFLRGGVILLPFLKALLLSVAEGKTLEMSLKDMKEQGSIIPKEAFPEHLGKRESFVEEQSGESTHFEPRPLALYITGHGLGGAFAALAGAAIFLDPELAILQPNPQGMGNPQNMQSQMNPMNQQNLGTQQSMGNQQGQPNQANLGISSGLRAVYTFGQPMFTDRNLAMVLEGKFGDRLFRHVYGKDIVPRLPPRMAGNFAHFGREYVDMRGVWVRSRMSLRQASMIVIGSYIGTLAMIKDMLPFAQWKPLQITWGDHSPLNYLRVSKAQPSGLATPGDELGSGAPGLC
jgi:hypothetical protein